MKKSVFLLALSVLSLYLTAQEKSVLDPIRKAFTEASVETYAPNEEVTERFIRYSDHGRANDVLLLQLYMYVHLPDREVERLLENFNWEKGCWNDIDYKDGTRGRWPATLHVTRMYALAKLYKAGNVRWKNSDELGRLLHLTMGWWFENMPKCPNWWHNDIGVPKKMTSVLLMLRDELSREEVSGGLQVLKRSKFGRTGQNKVALAGNNLMKGLLTDDEELVKQARDFIAEEIRMTDEEGIQEDWSFHQHGPQIQFGNYGLTYVDILSFWMRVLKGTEYDFTQKQKEIVVNLMKEGICWSVYKGVMDPSFCGRQNFIDAGAGKAYALSVAARNLSFAVDSESEYFARIARENLLPEEYRNTLTGARYFWRSDCGVYRRPGWYSSIRMHSERTIGFEFTNKENTLANFSADGAVLLMQDAGEFHNIFAFWDWRKVPGVTSYDDGGPIKCDGAREATRNNSSHVFGKAADEAMCATMELNRDGLYALKSSFFFPECIVCLGTDITASNPSFRSVTTAVDQIHLDGKIVRKDAWVWHSDRGYVSLDGAPMTVTADVQRGKWDLIEPAFKDKWDEGKVFKCWFEHPVDGSKGSYAYAIVPDASVSKVRRFASRTLSAGEKAPVKVIRNDSECQAVRCGDVISAIFHKEGQFVLEGKTFTVEAPSAVIREL